MSARRPLPTSAMKPGQVLVKAGLPLVMFTIGASLVVSSAVEGKNRERETFSGQNISKSERQARLEEEREDMLRKMQKAMEVDFDNTKRIERPDEILERRKKEREAKNRWYRRLGRWIQGKDE
mmetsp:Transcript_11492/g.16513  ORF Transcript_11492/g.16513 Transcript_11492/m.16513 type:complete len:123 (-) Transcript_11492:189-557(-)|eukprot:CAMPEP_0172423348 /NCGR_PEP_ID=MMETSP1064-20121228/15484_1 /TAXON_ID=202472 /ORGANISM="Aulacoseira subarctica , Strain CCAP 1002/5" /LENGTH=122 /DNA_ID=CAMNT_0013164673 /DNA_START=115 /DNA_END=483 /DNA_ORIENTATION=-